MSNLNKFVRSILENGGATYSLLTGEFNPESGYMVSLKGHERKHKTPIVPSKLSTDNEFGFINTAVSMFVSDFATCLANEGNFLGAWLHDGYLYLDVSKKVNTGLDAYREAVKNGQLAYFDNYKKLSVDTKKDPVPAEIEKVSNLEEIERAIFKQFRALEYKGKVFPIPTLQTSGTMQQNRDYVYTKAKEILFHELS